MSEFSLFLTPKILSQLDINSGPLSLYLSLSLSHTHTHSNHFTLHAFVFYFSLSLSLTLTHVPLCFICSFYLYRLKRIKTNGYYKSARLSKLRIKSFSWVLFCFKSLNYGKINTAISYPRLLSTHSDQTDNSSKRYPNLSSLGTNYEKLCFVTL